MIRGQPTAVQRARPSYRHYDAEGNLLYVGISLNSVVRLTQHRQASAGLTHRLYQNRALSDPEGGFIAEQIAIVTEGPKYNKALVNGSLRRDYNEPPYQSAKDERHVLRTR